MVHYFRYNLHWSKKVCYAESNFQNKMLPGPRGGAEDEKDPLYGSKYRLGAAGLCWETTRGLDSLRWVSMSDLVPRPLSPPGLNDLLKRLIGVTQWASMGDRSGTCLLIGEGLRITRKTWISVSSDGRSRPYPSTQERRGRKKWWRPRMHACADSAGQCHTLAAKAVLWPCCSHPLPT